MEIVFLGATLTSESVFLWEHLKLLDLMCPALFKIPNIAIPSSFFMKTGCLPSVLLLLSGERLLPDPKNVLELLLFLFFLFFFF